MPIIPAILVAGDSLQLPVALPAYRPADGWGLTARLVSRQAGGQVVELTATADGDMHVVQASASDTAAWPAGDYSWSCWVSAGGVVVSLESGQTQVLPDPRTALPGTDNRSRAARALDQALAALAAWTPTARKWQIGDRMHEFATAADVQAIVSFWRAEVRAEQRAGTRAAGGRLVRRTQLRVGR